MLRPNCQSLSGAHQHGRFLRGPRLARLLETSHERPKDAGKHFPVLDTQRRTTGYHPEEIECKATIALGSSQKTTHQVDSQLE